MYVKKEMTITIFDEWVGDMRDIDVVVCADVDPGSPGRTYGPLERCYPAEAPYVCIEEVRWAEANTDLIDLLSNKELVRLEECMLDGAGDDDYCDD